MKTSQTYAVANRARTMPGMLVVLLAVTAAAVSHPLASAEDAAKAAPPTLAAARPNILLVVVDTLRADRIAAKRNGIPVMPRTQRFAESAWYLTNTLSQESWTKPSVASIFTSLYPAVHRIQYGARMTLAKDKPRETDALPEGLPVMAALLREAGYKTVGVQTNLNLDKVTGFNQGFDEYRFFCCAAPIITAQAVDAARSLSQPFFLYVHYIDPHVPYIVTEARAGLFGGLPPIEPWEKDIVNQQESYHEDFTQFITGLQAEKKLPRLSPSGQEYMRYAYDLECALIDEEFASLLSQLGPALRNAIVIFVADHGEEFWDHGGIGHSRTVYDELVHVPLIMRFPGHEAKRDDRPVQSIDILPTLAAYLGLKTDPLWQGRNLLLPNDAPQETSLPRFTQAYGTFRETKVRASCVRVGALKLIRKETTGDIELYDVKQDSGEKQDLAKTRPDDCARLAALLDQHDKTCDKLSREFVPHKAVTLTPEMEQALKSLGYLAP